jgi:hypothetical protein
MKVWPAHGRNNVHEQAGSSSGLKEYPIYMLVPPTFCSQSAAAMVHCQKSLQPLQLQSMRSHASMQANECINRNASAAPCATAVALQPRR